MSSSLRRVGGGSSGAGTGGTAANRVAMARRRQRAAAAATPTTKTNHGIINAGSSTRISSSSRNGSASAAARDFDSNKAKGNENNFSSSISARANNHNNLSINSKETIQGTQQRINTNSSSSQFQSTTTNSLFRSASASRAANSSNISSRSSAETTSNRTMSAPRSSSRSINHSTRSLSSLSSTSQQQQQQPSHEVRSESPLVGPSSPERLRRLQQKQKALQENEPYKHSNPDAISTTTSPSPLRAKLNAIMMESSTTNQTYQIDQSNNPTPQYYDYDHNLQNTKTTLTTNSVYLPDQHESPPRQRNRNNNGQEHNITRTPLVSNLSNHLGSTNGHHHDKRRNTSTGNAMPYSKPSASSTAMTPYQKINTNSSWEEQDLVEEPEIGSHDKQILGASRLTHHARVLLKSGSWALVTKPQHKDQTNISNIPDRYQQENDKKMIQTASWSASLDNTTPGIELEIQGLLMTIHYGLPIALYAPSLGRYLGVQQSINSPGTIGGVSPRIGFFQMTPDNDGEKWTLLHGNRNLWVGAGAVRHAQPSHGSVVQSGDTLVLRHLQTGGLLSFGQQEQQRHLELLLHSYNSSSSSDNLPLVDRALQDDQIVPSEKQLFALWQAHVPPCPIWAGGGRVRHPGKNPTKEKSPESSVLPSQFAFMVKRHEERVLVDEVISSLLGLEGRLIRRLREDEKNDDNQGIFKLMHDKDKRLPLDRSRINLVERILPIATNYVKVESFVQKHQPGYEYGSVMQALCEEMQEMLQEYLHVVCSFEELQQQQGTTGISNTLTLNQLFCKMNQQPASTMTLLERVVQQAQNTYGGALLNTLRDLKVRVYFGDEHKQGLLTRLLEKASVPYMKMLGLWLQSGTLEDPCGEFMIQRRLTNSSATAPSKTFNEQVLLDGDNWNSTFTIRNEHILEGVLSSVDVDRILKTGKYWNAVHHCEDLTNHGSSSKRAPLLHDNSTTAAVAAAMPACLNYLQEASNISSRIVQMHRRASKYLLRLIFGEFQLEKSLVTIKRYFLLDQGDFLLFFLDAAEAELSKHREHVSRGRTQHWLNMAVQFTEPHGDDNESKASSETATTTSTQPLRAHHIRCSFASESLDVMLGIRQGEQKTPSKNPYGSVSGLTGMMSFMLDFHQIPFPTSLVISNHNMSQYQTLFRHVFYAKYVEQRLVGIWLDHQMMKEYQSIRESLGPTFCLRQRMLHFCQNFIYYIMLEVIEPNWLEFMATIPHQETVDHVMETHTAFLERTLEQCLLTNPAMIQSLTKLMSTCLLFSEQLKRFVEKTGIADDDKIARQRKRSSSIRRYNQQISTEKEALAKTIRAQRKERKSRIRALASLIDRELRNESYQRMILRYESVFDESLEEFIQNLRSNGGSQSHISNLCIRLDFNGFVSKRANHNNHDQY